LLIVTWLGGGMTYYEINPKINTSLVYGEGLRVPNTNGHLELDGLYGGSSLGKKKGYERVKKLINLGSNIPL